MPDVPHFSIYLSNSLKVVSIGIDQHHRKFTRSNLWLSRWIVDCLEGDQGWTSLTMEAIFNIEINVKLPHFIASFKIFFITNTRQIKSDSKSMKVFCKKFPKYWNHCSKCNNIPKKWLWSQSIKTIQLFTIKLWPDIREIWPHLKVLNSLIQPSNKSIKYGTK